MLAAFPGSAGPAAGPRRLVAIFGLAVVRVLAGTRSFTAVAGIGPNAAQGPQIARIGGAGAASPAFDGASAAST